MNAGQARWMILGPVLAVLMQGPAIAAGEVSIFGRWLTDDHSAVINVARCGQSLCGTIEQVLDPKAPTNDINNPDEAARRKPLVGTMILRDFKGKGARWASGQAYDPKAGKSYRSDLELTSDGKLKVTGCVLFVCRSRLWTRRF